MHDAWEKLMNTYSTTSGVLVASAMCDGSGKSLCNAHGVDSYPYITYGTPDNMKRYSGSRSYSDLLAFAEKHIGGASPSPGPSPSDTRRRRRRSSPSPSSDYYSYYYYSGTKEKLQGSAGPSKMGKGMGKKMGKKMGKRMGKNLEIDDEAVCYDSEAPMVNGTINGTTGVLV